MLTHTVFAPEYVPPEPPADDDPWLAHEQLIRHRPSTSCHSKPAAGGRADTLGGGHKRTVDVEKWMWSWTPALQHSIIYCLSVLSNIVYSAFLFGGVL